MNPNAYKRKLANECTKFYKKHQVLMLIQLAMKPRNLLIKCVLVTKSVLFAKKKHSSL